MTAIDIRKAFIPTEVKFLLDKHPRTSWEASGHFKQATRNWLAAHKSFRYLAERLNNELREFVLGQIDSKSLCEKLMYFGMMLLRNLHAHHSWEDQFYFPELRDADARFDDAISVLERDHRTLDVLLEEFQRRLMDLVTNVSSHSSALPYAEKLLNLTLQLEQMLRFHLSDEEEIAVPIILEYQLRD